LPDDGSAASQHDASIQPDARNGGDEANDDEAKGDEANRASPSPDSPSPPQPPAEAPPALASSAPAPSAAAPPGPIPWLQAVGAATAFVAVGLGLVYGLGAISIGLRLWYIKDPVTPVLGQLPSSFLLVDAFSEIILPAIAVGVGAYVLAELLLKGSWRRALTADVAGPWRSLLLIVFAAVLALVPLGFLQLNYGSSAVIRSYWDIYALCAGLNILSILLALRVLVLVREQERQAADEQALRGGRRRSLALARAAGAGARMSIAALALLPCVAFTFAAAAPLPVVYLCGPSFNHVDSSGRHYAVGNLIGISSAWAYIAETRVNSSGTTYIGNYIAVIPLSEVQLQAIGSDSECNNLVPPSPAPSPSPSPSAPSPSPS
jgi:hypothetical protein